MKRKKLPAGVQSLKRLDEEEIKSINFVAPNEVVVKDKKGGGQYVVTNEGMHRQIKCEDLEVLLPLGRGRQAHVKLVRHQTTGQLFAMKFVQFGEEMCQNGLIADLWHVLRHLDTHPNLVTSVDAYFCEGQLMILMEYMHLGSLEGLLNKSPKPVPMDILSLITKQVTEGLDNLHSHNVIHRDLKPSNILVNKEGQVKICDFGVSRQMMKGEEVHTMVGATAYLSPERIRGESYNQPSDVWALGLTVAELALGHFPWPALKEKNIFHLIELIGSKTTPPTVEWPSGSSISPELKDFVARCMRQDPSERAKCKELLEHPFITGCQLSAGDLARWMCPRVTKWVAKMDANKNPQYYINLQTGEMSETKPEKKAKKWKVVFDKDGRPFYYNRETKEKEWKKPPDFDDDTSGGTPIESVEDDPAQ